MDGQVFFDVSRPLLHEPTFKDLVSGFQAVESVVGRWLDWIGFLGKEACS